VSLETALRARDECLGERVAETLPVLDAAIAQVRELICRLSPPLLEERGLTVALQWSFSRLPRPADIALELHADDNIGRLDPDIELACYRIAQEAVANAVRHAGAHRISVRIGRIGGAVHIDVCDDGHGVPEHVLRDGQPGFGLRAMRERAAEVGGRLEIASSAGRGTRVTAVLPIAEKDRR
jgi:signal transduction histidine kinase